MPSSKGSSPPRDRIQVSLIAGGFFTIWASREALGGTRDREQSHMRDTVGLSTAPEAH